MAELVDAVVLGTIRKCPVQVQVLLPVREVESSRICKYSYHTLMITALGDCREIEKKCQNTYISRKNEFSIK